MTKSVFKLAATGGLILLGTVSTLAEARRGADDAMHHRGRSGAQNADTTRGNAGPGQNSGRRADHQRQGRGGRDAPAPDHEGRHGKGHSGHS